MISFILVNIVGTVPSSYNPFLHVYNVLSSDCNLKSAMAHTNCIIDRFIYSNSVSFQELLVLHSSLISSGL